MSVQLDELTAQARALTSAGDLTAARDLLGAALPATGADPADATPAVADAAALHAQLLVALGDPAGARTWAHYAYLAQRRLRGTEDERTVAAAATLAATLHRAGAHEAARRLYVDVVARLTEREGGTAPRTLAAEADLATAEHAAGHCDAALARLGAVWRRHRDAHGEGTPAGLKMLARLGAMERDCGRGGDGRHHLEVAADLCRTHLGPGHPLTAQVAGLVAGSADPGHRTVHAADRPDDDGDAPAAGVTAVPRQAGPAAGADDAAAGPGSGPAGADDAAAGPGSGPAGADDAAAGPGLSAAAPGVRRLAAPAAGTRTRPQPGHPPGTDLSLAPGPAGGHPASADGSAAGFHPGGPSMRVVVTAVAVAVALLAVLAVVLVTVRQRPGPRAAATAAAPAPSAAASPAPTAATSAPAAEPAAPTGLVLRDNRDSVGLSWAYPGGAEGPVLVSGGRAGQETRAFQQLPAGSDSYVVYGLDPANDYCFTVAVVYGTDTVRTSAPACTGRGAPMR